MEATLTEGSGVGEIDSGEHIYELRTFLVSSPTAGDTVELYSANLVVENGSL